MAYVTIPIETDEDANASLVFDFIASQFAGWTPSEGQLDVWMVLAISRLAADLKDMAANVADDIFRYFGPMIGVTPFDDVPATALTSWTLADTTGHTIEGGTRVGILDDNLDTHEFTVAADTIVPAGVSVVNEVGIVSSNAGSADNGLGSFGSQAVPLDGTVWVTTILLQGPTSGGQDAEDDVTFMGRLTDTLRTMAPRPIIPDDFAILARDVAGVVRSSAIDGYDPATATYGNERTITVVVTDDLGNALSAGVKTAVETYLQSQREVNFIVNVADPTVTVVDVDYDVNVWPNVDSTALEADILSALMTFLDPSTWGVPPGGDPNIWYNRTTIKINDLIAVIGSVPGVRDVNSVTMRTGIDPFSATDINLSGIAPLPRLGAVAGTFY